jgi:hypothetical protein
MKARKSGRAPKERPLELKDQKFDDTVFFVISNKKAKRKQRSLSETSRVRKDKSKAVPLHAMAALGWRGV